MSPHKLLRKALASPANLRFDEVCTLAVAFGFHLSRTKGSHHIFAYLSVRELVNLQNVKGKAKPYQVKQVRNVIFRYKLGEGTE